MLCHKHSRLEFGAPFQGNEFQLEIDGLTCKEVLHSLTEFCNKQTGRRTSTSERRLNNLFHWCPPTGEKHSLNARSFLRFLPNKAERTEGRGQ